MRTDRRIDHKSVVSRRLLLAAVLLPGVAGCVAAVGAPQHMAASAPALDPITFFAGPTHGTGTLHIVASKAQATDVTGRGVQDGDDAITLEQDVVRGKAAATTAHGACIASRSVATRGRSAMPSARSSRTTTDPHW